jgi:hypothetical protein
MSRERTRLSRKTPTSMRRLTSFAMPRHARCSPVATR